MTDVRHLHGAPRAAELYARAAAGAVLPSPVWGGSTLPDYTLELWDVRLDPGKIAAYSALTGFPSDAATVPITYPSLLGFGLGLRIMTDRGFPLRALGMIHVRDRITTSAPLHPGDTVRVDVTARDLRPHPKGAEVDLVTEVSTSHGGVVWTEVSTYLSRGAKAPAAPGGHDGAAEAADRPVPEPPADAPTLAWIEAPGDLGRRFAGVSGDRNPIHLSALTARAFGFPTAIAHGRWTMARSLAAVAAGLPDACEVTTWFRAPVRLPSTCAIVSTSDSAGLGVWLMSADRSRLHVFTRATGPA